jgi:hypothetical protein
MVCLKHLNRLYLKALPARCQKDLEVFCNKTASG